MEKRLDYALQVNGAKVIAVVEYLPSQHFHQVGEDLNDNC